MRVVTAGWRRSDDAGWRQRGRWRRRSTLARGPLGWAPSCDYSARTRISGLAASGLKEMWPDLRAPVTARAGGNACRASCGLRGSARHYDRQSTGSRKDAQELSHFASLRRGGIGMKLNSAACMAASTQLQRLPPRTSVAAPAPRQGRLRQVGLPCSLPLTQGGGGRAAGGLKAIGCFACVGATVHRPGNASRR